ncbi:hypothetical protein ACC710_37185, partial [Rhizobium ruizarguesonis]
PVRIGLFCRRRMRMSTIWRISGSLENRGRSDAGEIVRKERAAGGDSALAKYETDLTRRAREGKIDPVLGRDPEIRQIVDILMRR